MLLAEEGLPLDGVTLARHQDTRMRGGITMFRLWRNQPDEFARYEAVQGREVFHVGGYIASFVVDSEGDVVFVGLSRVTSCARNQEPVLFDYLDERNEPGEVFVYEFERDERLAPYEGRLVIDWGPGARSWCQRQKPGQAYPRAAA